MKRVFALVMAILMLLVMTSCGQKESGQAEQQPEVKENTEWPDTVTIATGNPGGAAYYIGAAQSQILDEAIEDVYFTVEATDGGFTMNGPFVQNDPDCMGMITISAMQEGSTRICRSRWIKCGSL